VSHWLLTSTTSRRYIYTVVRWTGIISILAIITSGWFVLFRRVQGTVEPTFVFVDILAIVTLAGTVIGLYDAERSESQAKLRQERDRRDALISSIADAAAEIEITEDSAAVVNTNQQYETLFPDRKEPLPDEFLDRHPARSDDGQSIPADGGVIEQEVTRQTRSGPRPFRLRSVPIEQPNGSQRRYIVYSDLSDTAEAQQRIAALESELDAITDLQDIAITAELEGVERLERLLETSRETIDADVGVLCTPFIPESDSERRYRVEATTNGAPVD
ncbi:MAG: hypothetical protein ABEI52_00650, partial [Halobacteriaceae archaeon]